MITERAWEAFGYRIGYKSATRELDSLLSRVILPNWTEVDPASSDAWVEVRDDKIYDNGIYWTSAQDEEQLTLRLSQVTQMRLTWSAERFIFLHCGVVRLEDHAWLFPGLSKAGKSTVVKEFCRRGAAFYSDEYAVFDEDGLVHSYPRALWTRVTRRKREPTDPLSLGWKSTFGPISAARVYLCPFKKTSDEPPAEVGLSEIIEELVALLCCAPDRRSSARERLTHALASARCWMGKRGEVNDFASQICGSDT